MRQANKRSHGNFVERMYDSEFFALKKHLARLVKNANDISTIEDLLTKTVREIAVNSRLDDAMKERMEAFWMPSRERIAIAMQPLQQKKVPVEKEETEREKTARLRKDKNSKPPMTTETRYVPVTPAVTRRNRQYCTTEEDSVVARWNAKTSCSAWGAGSPVRSFGDECKGAQHCLVHLNGVSMPVRKILRARQKDCNSAFLLLDAKDKPEFDKFRDTWLAKREGKDKICPEIVKLVAPDMKAVWAAADLSKRDHADYRLGQMDQNVTPYQGSSDEVI
jgi:hypothetical protein